MMRSLFNRRGLSITSCLVGLYTAMGIPGACQQVSSQVNNQVNATSVSSSVQSGVDSTIRASSVPMVQIGTVSESGNRSTSAHTGLSAFSGTRSPSVFSSGMQSRIGESQSGLARGETGASGSPLSKSSGTQFSFHPAAGNGLRIGQFPDSTRERVGASPFLSGNSLEFFTTALPQFAPQFDRERHLNPSYAVTGARLSPRTKFGQYLGLAPAWSSGLDSGHDNSVHLQMGSGLMNDPLGADAIADPLRHELGSGLSGDEPK